MNIQLLKLIGFVVIAVLLVWGGISYNKRSSFKQQDLVLGEGREAKNGDKLAVHYEGTFLDGKVFDSSYQRGQPFEFTLGAGEVIRGWDLGVLGMRVGEKRTLVIPPELGYGARQVGPIPPNSTLKFTIELLEVR